LQKKQHENQPPNQKLVLPVAQIFKRVKITTFFKHGLQNSYSSSEKPSNRHLNKKNDVKDFFIFFQNVKFIDILKSYF
jgi:hypothetical protein